MGLCRLQLSSSDGRQRHFGRAIAGDKMTKEMLKSWLEAYGRAWETRSPETACALFADDATYQETPFVEAMRGRRAIEDYWSRATGSHADVHFGYEILALNGSEGIAHWWCSFVRLPA